MLEYVSDIVLYKLVNIQIQLELETRCEDQINCNDSQVQLQVLFVQQLISSQAIIYNQKNTNEKDLLKWSGPRQFICSDFQLFGQTARCCWH